MSLFDQQCAVCAALTADLFRHLAWHAELGHDMSSELQARLDEVGQGIRDAVLAREKGQK